MESASHDSGEPLRYQLNDLPNENYFYADENVSCQMVLTSPLPLPSPREHRLLFVWPNGNSACAAFFTSSGLSSDNALQIRLRKSAVGQDLQPVRYEAQGSVYPSVGVTGLVEITHPATLKLAILGSARSVRDYTEGGVLNPAVQDGVLFEESSEQMRGMSVSRLWFDEKTTMRLSFMALSPEEAVKITSEAPRKEATFPAGIYKFEAHLNYPQTQYLTFEQLLKPEYHHLNLSHPRNIKSLSFLCNSEKLLAGAWRFLTYFGRDSMISLLLLAPILNDKIIDIGLSAVLERVKAKDGSVCHEESIGDYPAAQATSSGVAGTEAEYDYKMIDTDFLLPILVKQHFLGDTPPLRGLMTFLGTQASLIPANKGMTYGQLLSCTCSKILDMAAKFATSSGSYSFRNLVGLKDGHAVGQWRDSDDGLGGGRYPYDVNTALIPASLRAIAQLAQVNAFPDHRDWHDVAEKFAQVWESEPLALFQIKLQRPDAIQRLEAYKRKIGFKGPACAGQINEDLQFEAIALREDGCPVEIMHTDTCFRLMLLPHLICTSDKLSMLRHLRSLDCITQSILRTFPAGLFTPVGTLITNPAFSSDPLHAEKLTSGAYHGTVVWSWNSLVMLTKGVEAQLSAASEAKRAGGDAVTIGSADPTSYSRVLTNMKTAYAKLWDMIENHAEHLESEVWSWRWEEAAGNSGEGDFAYVPLSHVSAPDGGPRVESNATQLWSLASLALKRRNDLMQ